MIWSNVRGILSPQCIDFKDFGHVDKVDKKVRSELLTKYDSICHYCGGKYLKYLICTYFTESKSSDICCKLCHMVTHLNYGITKEIDVYYSKLSQVDVVKLTVEYIINNNEVPEPYQIDNDVKMSPVSLLEFTNIINNYDSYPNELTNYKIFFMNCLNTDFITNNYGEKMSMFLSDDIKFNKIIEHHIPLDNELVLFNKHFGLTGIN